MVAYWSANDGGGTTLTNTQGNSSLDGVLRLDAAWTANGSGHFGQAGDFALDLTGIATSGVDVFGLTTSFTEVTITA